MDENRAMTPELEEALKQWAKEALEGIGVIEGRHADFDKMAEKVIAQLRSTYTDTTIDMFLRTADNRKIDAPDGFARVAGSCGDTMEFFLTVRDGVIVDASFQTDGCSPSQAAGGMAAKMVRGKTTEEAKRYTPRMALDALGGLPEDHQHCATLAMDAMHQALEDFAAKRS